MPSFLLTLISLKEYFFTKSLTKKSLGISIVLAILAKDKSISENSFFSSSIILFTAKSPLVISKN